MHVVPRWGGDTNFMPVIADTKVMPQSIEQSYAALKGAFRAPGSARDPHPRARPGAGGAGRHPPLADPHPVRRRAGQLLPVEDEPLTLVDTGPNSGKALDELERQLASAATRSTTSS